MKPGILLTSLALCGLFACDLPIYEDVKPECNITAEFTPTPTACVAPCLVSINNTSNTSACEVTYTWDFGDDSPPAFGQSPGSHNYDEIGVYNLCLTIVETADPTNIDTACVTINVTNPTDPPVAAFTATPANCFGPCNVTFTSTSVGAIDHEWYFDGQLEPVTGQQITHTFPPSHEPYLVELKVSNSGGRDSVTQEVIVDWRTFDRGYLEEDLGGAIGLSAFANGQYFVVGSEQQGPTDFATYGFATDEGGGITAGPCMYQLSDFDFPAQSITLSTGEVMVVGSTVNPNGANNDVLLIKINPAAPCSAVPIRVGMNNRRENGRALIEATGPSGVELIVAGDIASANGPSVLLSRYTDEGHQVGAELVIPVAGESLFVSDLVRAPDGSLWISGRLDPNGADDGQAMLWHASSTGNFLNSWSYGEAGLDERFTSLAINAAGTHLLAVGYAQNGSGSIQMTYLRFNLSNTNGAVLQYLTTPVREARSIVVRSDGQLLIAGSGDGGATLQLMSETGNVSLDADFGNSLGLDFFTRALVASDGGYAAVGLRGGRVFFVKTDDQFSL